MIRLVSFKCQFKLIPLKQNNKRAVNLVTKQSWFVTLISNSGTYFLLNRHLQNQQAAMKFFNKSCQSYNTEAKSIDNHIRRLLAILFITWIKLGYVSIFNGGYAFWDSCYLKKLVQSKNRFQISWGPINYQTLFEVNVCPEVQNSASFDRTVNAKKSSWIFYIAMKMLRRSIFCILEK